MEPDYRHLTDEALMQAFQAGDARAFDELYRRWFARLARWLEHAGLQASEAEALANDVLVRVWIVNRP